MEDCFLGDSISVPMCLGAVAGISGIILVFSPEIERFDFSDDTVASLGLAIVGTLSASCGMLTSATIQRRNLPVIRSNAWGMVYGALFMLCCIWFKGISFEFDASAACIGSLLFLAVFASVLGFGCFLTLIGRIGAGKAAYATVLFPILALAISTVLENYQWGVLSILGVWLALGGNILILMEKEK